LIASPVLDARKAILSRVRKTYVRFFIILIFFSLLIFYIVSHTDVDSKVIITQLFLLRLVGLTFAKSLNLVIQKRVRSVEAKNYIILAISMMLWFIAELNWSINQLFFGILIPYPSVSDIFWLVGFGLINYHIYSTFRFWRVNLKISIISILTTSLISIALIVYLVFSISNTNEGINIEFVSTLVTDIAYISQDGISIIPSILILYNLKQIDPMFLHRIFISLFVFLNAIGDIGFTYSFTFFDESEFATFEHYFAMIYSWAYLSLLTALFWYDSLLKLININIDTAVKDRKKVLQNLLISKKEHPTAENKISKELDSIKIKNYIITLIKYNKNKKILFLITDNNLFHLLDCLVDLRNLVIHNNKVRLLVIPNLQDELIKKYEKSGVNIRKIKKHIPNDSSVIIFDNAILIINKGIFDNVYNAKAGVYSENDKIVISYVSVFENMWALSLLDEKRENLNIQKTPVLYNDL
jgi:hypothetical protein